MNSRQDRSTRSSELPVFGTRVGTPCDVTQVPRLLKFHAPEIVFGPGSLAEAGFAAERLGAHRPFVVTDPGLMATGWVDELLGYVRQRGLVPTLWHGVTPNPKDHEVAAGFQRYAESGCDVIIAIGGGSLYRRRQGCRSLERQRGLDPGLRRGRPVRQPHPTAADDPLDCWNRGGRFAVLCHHGHGPVDQSNPHRPRPGA